MKQRIVVEVLKLVKRFIVDGEFRATVLDLRTDPGLFRSVTELRAHVARRPAAHLLGPLMDRVAEDPENAARLARVLSMPPGLLRVAIELDADGPARETTETLLHDQTIHDFAVRAITAVAASKGARILVTRLLDRLAEDPANEGPLEKVLALDPAQWRLALMLHDTDAVREATEMVLQHEVLRDFALATIRAGAASKGARILVSRVLDLIAEDPENGGRLEKVLGLDPALWAVAVQLRDAGPVREATETLLRDRTLREFALAALDAAESKPGRVTVSTLFEVLQEHRGAIGKVNRVLKSLRRADRIALFDYLDRWLAHRPADFQRVVEAESRGSETPPGLAMALADWANRETLRAALSRSRMREVYLRELFPAAAEVSVPVGVIHEESHHANKVDMAYVCAIAAARGAKTIFEFGTYRGQTTIALAGISDDVRVYTLNLPPEDDPRYAPYIGQFIQASPHRARITQLFVHSGRLDTTPYAQKMDFIFIDGDHSYEMVKNDTEKALQMLRPGGTIVWHDYAAKTAGVVDYLREFSQDRPLFHIRNTCLAVFMDGVDAETVSLAAMPPSLEAEEVSPDGRPLPATRTFRRERTGGSHAVAPAPAVQPDGGERRES